VVGVIVRSGVDRRTVETVLAKQLGRESGPSVTGSPDDIAPEEWDALRTPQDEHDPRDYFITRKATRPGPERTRSPADAALDSLITSAVLVDRLREVRVLTGFERHTTQAVIPANLREPHEFLPAVEVFGEGFFLQFDEDALVDWETRDEVKQRCSILAARAEQANARWLKTRTPRFVMLHTLAHLLLRNTAFEAGYSTSSLRERLYVTGESQPSMAGILIYTYYSRGFSVCDCAAAQRDVLFSRRGYTVSPPSGCGWLPGSGCGEESGVVVVPAGGGLVSSASL
jgi:hypothetical protein